ncbi:inositol monophosphatase family protein [Desulfohalovibrio reitneri]|uniref:inositol monophosphatase family protein n=1 Tax=Desulfohalovibrio reitneri TaxID=1307759 RepID=UPI0004A7349A|nr:inositol monophosphatase family protein [Desulfohalovibrio reitneri]
MVDSAAILLGMIDLAEGAGEIIRHDWDRTKDVRHKGRIDLVTETDVRVEEYLKKGLAGLLPEADFLAEETAPDADASKLTWVIDPVDGTTNFAHGFPFVATSIALWREGRVELGVIHAPMLGEIFSASRGGGAFLNGRPIGVTDNQTLQESVVATGFPYAIEEYVDQITAHLRRLLVIVQGVRRPGSAAIDLAYLAAGRYDGFYEYALNPWDTAAGWLLVEEAGGRVSTFREETPYAFGSKEILATNGRIHRELSELLLLDA